MKRHKILISLVVLLISAVFFSLKVDAAQSIETTHNEDMLSIKLLTENKQKFEFGQFTPSTFVIQNLSEKALVILGIRFITNSTEDPISLASSVYGSISKIDNQEGYSYNQLSQQATSDAFYAGFLLPGERVMITTNFRPVSQKESLYITYIASSDKYNGTKESLKPLNPYIPKYIEGKMPVYYPFNEPNWLSLSQTYPSTGQVGPDAPKRAILMPDLKQEKQHIIAAIPISYQADVFSIESAEKTASKISGLKSVSFKLAYSNALGGFIVFEDNCIWILKNENQTIKGDIFNKCPPSLFKDIDLKTSVSIRVGDKQEGFGPEEHPAGKKFWDKYPIYYGDGMYTNGEFISIDKNNLLLFLKDLTQNRIALKEHSYYFSNKYFEIAPVIYGSPKAQLTIVTETAELQTIEDQNQIVEMYFKLKYLTPFQMGQIIQPFVNSNCYIAVIDEVTMEIIDTVGNLIKLERIIKTCDISSKNVQGGTFTIKEEPNEEMVYLSVSNLALREILGVLAKWTGKKIVATDEAENLRITVLAETQVRKSTAINLIFKAINESGYTVEVTKDTIYIKLKPPEQKQANILPIVTDAAALGKIEDQNQIVGMDFTLKYLRPSDVVQLIQPIMSEKGFMTTDNLVIDTVRNMIQIERVISMFDVPPGTGGFFNQLFEIRDPNEIKRIIQLFIGEANQPKVQIQIETTIFTASKELLKEIGKKLNMTLDSNVPLDDRQVESLLKSVQASKDSKIIVEPNILAVDRQSVSLFKGKMLPFITGYTEPNNPSQEAKPIYQQRRVGTFCEIVPIIKENETIQLRVRHIISQITGSEERTFNGKYKAEIPTKSEVIGVSIQIIPYGKTAFVDCGTIILYDNNLTDSPGKKKVIILVKPTVLSQEQTKNSS
jgi:hypothetical protein